MPACNLKWKAQIWGKITFVMFSRQTSFEGKRSRLQGHVMLNIDELLKADVDGL